jgi:pimeloyl-ACP methyl ester carboxylesterase
VQGVLFDFVGHSMGGIVSMTAALAHPGRVEGLVLIGTASQCSEKVACGATGSTSSRRRS